MRGGAVGRPADRALPAVVEDRIGRRPLIGHARTERREIEAAEHVIEQAIHLPMQGQERVLVLGATHRAVAAADVEQIAGEDEFIRIRGRKGPLCPKRLAVDRRQRVVVEQVRRVALNDDAQPSVTDEDEALHLADVAAGVAPGEATDDPTLNDDAQPETTHSADVLRQADEIAGVFVVAAAEPEEVLEEEADEYDEMTKDELQEELAARGLPTSGNKDELIERLRG